MVYVRMLTSWPCAGTSHVVLRIDIYNATGLSYRNVKIGLGVSRTGTQGEKHVEAWSFVEGLSRPFDQTVDALSCRSSVTLWRDLHLRAVQPLCVGISISYENTSPQTEVTPIGADTLARGGGSIDEWSDDENEDSFRLQFSCHPCPLPLSVFFRPFHGFDSLAGSVFPPPSIFIACPNSRTEKLSDFGMDLQKWIPSGFHRMSWTGCRRIVPDVQACYAGVSFDDETLVCFLCRGPDGSAPQVLEVRSNAERVLRDLADNLHFWILAS